MRPGFLNDNANRNYPFLAGSSGYELGAGGQGLFPSDLCPPELFPPELYPPYEAADVVDPSTLQALPTDALVDAGFLMGVESGFVEGLHNVWLQRIYRTVDRFYFVFQSDAPGLVGQELTFCRDLGDGDYATSFYEQSESEAEVVLETCGLFPPELFPPELFPPELFPCHGEAVSEDSVSSLSSEESEIAECQRPLLWTGYVTSGTLETLGQILAAGGVMTGQLLVEPGLIRSSVSAWMQSANLANTDRVRAETPEDCKDYCWPFDPGAVFVQSVCLQGRLRFKEGFNCAIRQNNVENSITIGASEGGGAGQPCEEVPLFVGEEPPIGGSFLTGGPGCGELIRTINGVGGARLNVIGGVGVAVTAYPSQNRIVVDVDMSRLAVCGVDDSSEYSYDSIDYGDDCDCGPI